MHGLCRLVATSLIWLYPEERFRGVHQTDSRCIGLKIAESRTIVDVTTISQTCGRKTSEPCSNVLFDLMVLSAYDSG